jgi:hypothetical protein
MSTPRRRTETAQVEESLLSLRAAVVFLYALLASSVVGGLAHLAGQPWTMTLTAGIGAFAATVTFTNKVIVR